ncbi:KUP/HAK/KT family potassium transporter [Trinickia sp.]|uniref:KUP/HAK/KT family potassium transporter n=1 Tax=Trinickia sp. TaxID=2571163 RepID=UPI003F7EB8F4
MNNVRALQASEPTSNRDGTIALALAALGIVFGDLGTSPLYALQASFGGTLGVYEAMATTFYLGRESLTVQTKTRPGRRILLTLFALLRKNELAATAHLALPPNRVVELGARLDLV